MRGLGVIGIKVLWSEECVMEQERGKVGSGGGEGEGGGVLRGRGGKGGGEGRCDF